MLSLAFQQKIYNAYKTEPDAEIKHGRHIYAIAYNSCCTVHTWIIRREITQNTFHWLQPLDESIR